MIYVDLKGNLGNQLFIYAFARKIQYITGQNIVLSTYNLEKYFPDYTLSINQYKLNEKCSIDKFKFPFYLNPNFFLNKVFNKIFPPKNKIRMFFEKVRFTLLRKFGILYWMGDSFIDVDFNSLKSFKNIYVSGFWQSPMYFEDIRDILKSELEPNESLSDESEKLLGIIKSTNSTCVTIRRGDYVSNSKIVDMYYLCDLKYFKKGIDLIDKESSNSTLICFSDDIAWAKENITTQVPTYFESGKDSVSHKLLLMSNCKNFILSNSSFSWWAEFLSDNSGITYAPSRWYSNGSGNDIYRENWKLIPVGEDIYE